MTTPIKLYWHGLSGHSHRAQLMLSLLRLPFETVPIDLAAAEHKQPPFLAINPRGTLPVLDDDGTIVSDSTAILVYLARTYDASDTWLPLDPITAATVIRQLSFADGPARFAAADARLINVFGAKLDKPNTQRIADRHFPGLEQDLAAQPFLAGPTPTIADVANYTYIAHAPEGDISLAPYPNIRAWLARVEALPGFVPMQRTAAGLQKAA